MKSFADMEFFLGGIGVHQYFPDAVIFAEQYGKFSIKALRLHLRLCDGGFIYPYFECLCGARDPFEKTQLDGAFCILCFRRVARGARRAPSAAG